MSGTFQDICWNIIDGFRDAILGSIKLLRMDEAVDEAREIKSDEPKTTLARRRAEKQKTQKKSTMKESEPRVMNRVFMCCAWNGGVFWMSILIFNYVLLPSLRWMTQTLSGSTETNVIWAWMGPMLSWTFHTLWILPLFVLSKIVNCFWFADVADLAYRRTRGRPQLPNISVFIADMLFSILLQVFFLIQGTAASFIPIPAVGHVTSILHMSLLYSLYSFEYKWINMGWELHRRLSHIENKWSYFLGFGLPMAVLTILSSSFFVSGCVFSILFPIFIISANEADDMQKTSLFPLKLFAPVVAITNALFNRSLKKPGSQRQVTTVPSGSKNQNRDVSFR